MKKVVLLVFTAFMVILGGCSGNDNNSKEFMPEVKSSSDIFEIYDYKEQKLIKNVDMSSGEDVLLICDSIINNVNSEVSYLSTMEDEEPEYVLLYCGETPEDCIYIKIRFSEGKLYREVYGASGDALNLDQGILECLAVTEEEFRSILE